MTMSKEMERLKSKISFNKALINIYDYMNFISKSNKYDRIIKYYQNELTEVCKKILVLKEEKLLNEQITLFYNIDKKHPNDYIVKRVLTQDLEYYTLSSYYMINGKFRVFPSNLKLSGEKLNCFLIQCMKADFFDKKERQYIMEGI